ncbi:hypothetical protein AB6Q56_10840 [Dechloromonas sp. ARDL1]|uniref:hypothetical protein n=1 Tax=Dechloromonas sp. ARDL1 TaxID=3322121 RepID=UPI003DA6EFBA
MPSATTRCAEQISPTTLGGLRRLLGLSQFTLAGRLGVSQPHVAQIENQANMHLETLRRHIAALGGELELIVHLSEQRIKIILPEGDAPHPPLTPKRSPS